MTQDAAPPPDPNDPLFSLARSDGAGALLAAAAGDVAGGTASDTYSAVTQAATVLCYHLLVNGRVERDSFSAELVELAGGRDGRFTYRSPTPEFAEWLRSSIAGNAVATAVPSAEPAARVSPVGVFFRKDPEALVEAAVASSRVTHLDAATAVAAAAAAGAVAGSCFAQTGADLVLGAAETADHAHRFVLAEPYRFGDVAGGAEVAERLRTHAMLAAAAPSEIASGIMAGDAALDPILRVVFGIVMGAASGPEPFRSIEVAAVTGGSEIGSVTGAIIGARSGVVQWPWRVHNDTWFAELGKRLVAGRSEVRDLPIPYAVEERMSMTTRPKASEETI